MGNEACTKLQMQALPSFSSTIQSCNSCPSFTLKSSSGCCSTQTEVNAAMFIERDFSSKEFHRLENKDLLHPTDAEINLSVNKEITLCLIQTLFSSVSFPDHFSQTTSVSFILTSAIKTKVMTTKQHRQWQSPVL